jgi:hypothetical protein
VKPARAYSCRRAVMVIARLSFAIFGLTIGSNMTYAQSDPESFARRAAELHRQGQSLTRVIELPPLEPAKGAPGQWKPLTLGADPTTATKSTKDRCAAMDKVLGGMTARLLFSGEDSARLRNAFGSKLDTPARDTDSALQRSLAKTLGLKPTECQPYEHLSWNRSAPQRDCYFGVSRR